MALPAVVGAASTQGTFVRVGNRSMEVRCVAWQAAGQVGGAVRLPGISCRFRCDRGFQAVHAAAGRSPRSDGQDAVGEGLLGRSRAVGRPVA